MSKQDLEASMQKSVESTQRMFNTIRTGRANSSLLDRISVEYYGADTPLKSLATLTTPDSQTIQIQPFDISSLAGIEKAIAMSELGFTPNNDGKIIRIMISDMSRLTRRPFRTLSPGSSSSIYLHRTQLHCFCGRTTAMINFIGMPIATNACCVALCFWAPRFGRRSVRPPSLLEP